LGTLTELPNEHIEDKGNHNQDDHNSHYFRVMFAKPFYQIHICTPNLLLMPSFKTLQYRQLVSLCKKNSGFIQKQGFTTYAIRYTIQIIANKTNADEKQT
jgi:hypothetical protein